MLELFTFSTTQKNDKTYFFIRIYIKIRLNILGGRLREMDFITILI